MNHHGGRAHAGRAGILGACVLILAGALARRGGNRRQLGDLPAHTTRQLGRHLRAHIRPRAPRRSDADGSSNFAPSAGDPCAVRPFSGGRDDDDTTLHVRPAGPGSRSAPRGSFTVATFLPASSALTFKRHSESKLELPVTQGTCGRGLAALDLDVSSTTAFSSRSPSTTEIERNTRCSLNSGSGRTLISGGGAPTNASRAGRLRRRPFYRPTRRRRRSSGADPVVRVSLILASG